MSNIELEISFEDTYTILGDSKRPIVEVEIEVLIDSNTKTIKCDCDCVAGESGKCKHTFATLIFINRQGIFNLEQISCTDTPQKWGKVKKNLSLPYENVIPIDKYCHFEKADAYVNYGMVDEETNNLFFHKLIDCNPDSEAAIHFSRRRRTKTYVKTIPYSQEYILNLSLVHSLLQRDENLKFESVDICNNYSNFYEKYVQISHCESVELFMKTLGQMNDL
ncbi:hypothetical protein TKK_0012072 [Trichogramma kaykai]